MINTIIIDDCLQALKALKNESADFIITSPPYAKQRQEVYGGTEPDKYIEWFIPISLELKRVLKKVVETWQTPPPSPKTVLPFCITYACR